MYGYQAEPAVSASTSAVPEAVEGSSTSTGDQSSNTQDENTTSSSAGESCSWIHGRVGAGDGDEEDDDEDEDYDENADMEGDFEDDETPDWRRSINVGEEYQAVVPEGLDRYDDVPAYENEDKIVWDPNRLPDDEVEKYLNAVRETETTTQISSRSSESSSNDSCLTRSGYVPDNEQALLLLHQCGHKPDEAVRRRMRMQSPQHSNIFEESTQWSEEECVNFEAGLKEYNKDFHLIQKNMVPTRSVSEVVNYYYKWKKTERHDEFVSKFRLEKKKYLLHPTTTDFMDRFIEEMDTSAAGLAHKTNHVSSSSSSMIPVNYQGNYQTQTNRAFLSDHVSVTNGVNSKGPEEGVNNNNCPLKPPSLTQNNGQSINSHQEPVPENNNHRNEDTSPSNLGSSTVIDNNVVDCK